VITFKALRFPITLALAHAGLLSTTLTLGLLRTPSPLYESRGFESVALRGPFYQGRLVWDANWYLSIARDGYTNSAQHSLQKDTAFFPGFPMLIRGLDQIIGDPFWSGWWISLFFGIAATCAVYFWAYEVSRSELVARKTAVLLLFFPSSFILTHTYSEAQFLFFTCMSFYFARKGHWILSGILGACGTATRVVGSALIGGLALLAAAEKSASSRYKWLGSVGLPSLGIMGVLAYFQFLTGDPFIFSKSQFVPGWAGSEGWDSFARWISQWQSPPPIGIDPFWFRTYGALCLGTGIGLGVWGLFRKNHLRPELLFSVATLLGSAVLWRSGGRFVVVLPVLFFLMAERIPALILFGVIAPLLLLLQVGLQNLFVHWNFIF
jgi:hypothetical protein